MAPIDQVNLHFDQSALLALDLVLAFVMFGVALDIKLKDFKEVSRQPKGFLVGAFCQFLILPAIASGLVWLLNPTASVGLGIILVAACPGGNLSNFLTSFARGNAALSVSMSSLSTICSIIMTPFNLTLWAGINPVTNTLLRSVEIAPLGVLWTIIKILIIPTVLGVIFSKKFPKATLKMIAPFRTLSFLLFVFFLGIALVMNWQNFLNFVGESFWIVLFTNGAGLIIGYQLAKLAKLKTRDAKAISFEVGVQNSGFGLILIFNFFNGLGGMAVTAAWWGVWHLISGLSLAAIWAKSTQKVSEVRA